MFLIQLKHFLIFCSNLNLNRSYKKKFLENKNSAVVDKSAKSWEVRTIPFFSVSTSTQF